MIASTLRSAIETAWQRTLYNKPQLSPLLTAIREATLALSNDDKTPKNYRTISSFTARIASKTTTTHSPNPALRYSTDWSGEWHVTNADLEIWSRFDMWMQRTEIEAATIDSEMLFGQIGKALGYKRLHQAYTRYHANGGLTKTHCILLSKMGWEMDCGRGDWISLHVQGKRPFGNSSIDYDIYEHAGWPRDWPEDDGMSPAQSEKAWDLFDELVFAATDSALRAASTFDQRWPALRHCQIFHLKANTYGIRTARLVREKGVGVWFSAAKADRFIKAMQARGRKEGA